MRASATATLLTLAGIGLAHAAGTVNVSFIEPDKFVDVGKGRFETPDTLGTLERHLQQLGQRHLADGQVLTIDVLDIDLAGTAQSSPRTAGDVRVVKGNSDWPHVKLRYTLEAPGQAPRRGEESIADPGYLKHTLRYPSSDPLRYEKQMLDRWFKSRFAPKKP